MSSLNAVSRINALLDFVWRWWRLRVLMIGWEFPPYNAGGLGVACQGLSRALASKNLEICFIVPFYPENRQMGSLKLIAADNVKVKGIDSLLQPYTTSSQYDKKRANSKGSLYGANLFQEVERFAALAAKIAEKEEFDVIHAHDWLTYPAGMAIAKQSGKPLVVHVHATEFDRTGGQGVNQKVYDIERKGMHFASKVITVSNFTKQKVIKHYAVQEHKIFPVHNAIEHETVFCSGEFPFKKDSKIVLFLGRVTIQKGPDYFVYAAKKVLDKCPGTKFVVVGSGDMLPFMINKSIELGIEGKIFFTGFLRGQDLKKAYQLADVYVMPSVSEPYGLTALEAMQFNAPVIVSKQSGVSEAVNHCLKVDFWDIEKMAGNIVSVLQHSELSNCMKFNASNEVKKISWDRAAGQCIDVYKKAIQGGS